MTDVYGIKIGSKYSVVYGAEMDEPNVIPTCVAKIEVPERGTYDYKFGIEAEYYPSARYPILHGMPKGNGEDAELINKFLHHLKEKYAIPSDSFIVFCYPAMRAVEANEFKKITKSLDWGRAVGVKSGAVFSYEALCGAIDALGGAEQARSLPAVSVINFGSSTTEFVMFQNFKVVGGEGGKGMRTEAIGGSDIDKYIANLCSEQSHGGEVGPDTARKWKEQHADLVNMSDIKPFTETVFIRSKSGSEEVTFPPEGGKHPIVEAYREYTDRFIQAYDNYLGELKLENEMTVNALIDGVGTCVATGGVINTPGFGDWITSEIRKKFGQKVIVKVCENGVTAPAKGAYLFADYIINAGK